MRFSGILKVSIFCAEALRGIVVVAFVNKLMVFEACVASLFHLAPVVRYQEKYEILILQDSSGY